MKDRDDDNDDIPKNEDQREQSKQDMLNDPSHGKSNDAEKYIIKVTVTWRSTKWYIT